MDMKQVTCSEKIDKRGGLRLLVNTPKEKEYRLCIGLFSVAIVQYLRPSC